MHTRSGRLLASAAALALLAALLAVPSAALALNRPLVLTHPVFSITLGGCIRGTEPAEYRPIHIAWRDHAGHLKAKFNTMSSEYGNWQAPDAVCAANTVHVGDRLTAHITYPSDITRTFTVKGISGSFSRKTNVVSGTAPASGLFAVEPAHPLLSGHDIQLICDHQTTVSPSGHFSFDTTNCAPGYDATGGDEAFLEWISPGGDREQWVVHAPYLDVLFETPHVSGYARGTSSVSLTLESKSGAVRGTAHAAVKADGSFSTKMRHSGNPVDIKAGNRIAGNWAESIHYPVPAMSVIVSLGDDTVTGTCTPNTAYGLLVTWGIYSDTMDGTTDGAGSTPPFDLSGEHQIAAGDKVTFVCARPNGDRTTASGVLP